MKYPRIKPEFDRRRKYTPQMYKLLSSLYLQGFGISILAKEFDMHYVTVKRIVDPHFRQLESNKKNQWNKDNRQRVEAQKKNRRSEDHKYLRIVGGAEMRAYETSEHRRKMRENPDYRHRQYLSIKKSRLKRKSS